MKNNYDKRFAKRFGTFICDGRMAKNLSQTETAEGLGVSQAYYSYIESGNRSIDLNMAMRICTFLDLDLGEFIRNYSD